MSDLLITLGGFAALVLAFFSYGKIQKRQGRADERADQAHDTLNRLKEGRDAVSDARRSDGDLADRLRRNDGRW